MTIKKFKIKFTPDTRSCAKVTVIAVLVKGKKYWYGSNWCEMPQKTCPRQNYPTGVGYEICKNVCKQPNHAEIDALLKAGEEAKGSELYIIGHTILCDSCKKKVNEAGVTAVHFGYLPQIVIDY